MNREDVIRMAREAGASPDGRLWLMYAEDLERFAEIIAAREREACAKVCEDIYNDPEGNNGYDCYYARPYLDCADDIRARGIK